MSSCPHRATHVVHTDYGTYLVCESCVQANHMLPLSSRREGQIAAGTRCLCEHAAHEAGGRHADVLGKAQHGPDLAGSIAAEQERFGVHYLDRIAAAEGDH